MSNWKDRLRAFDDLAPDEAVYARAAQGPRHDVPDGPSGRKRLVAGVVAFAVFGAAAVLGWQAFQGTADQPASPSSTAVVITLMGTEGEPTATVNFDDMWQAGVFEKYTWCSTPDDCATVETDLPYPPIEEGVEVPVGAPIKFAGDAQVERAVIRTIEGDQASRNVIADTDGKAISVPDAPGDYLIWVAADWDRGSGAFYVRVHATPSEQASGGMVQSGGTYRLFDLSVVFPLGQSAEASHANVSYSYEWTTEFFPGAAGCKVFLFDENGRSMGDQPFGLTSLSASLSSGSITVPVAEGTPATAEGSCGPGIVYEGPWNVSNVRIEGSDVRFDLAPDAVASHGSAVCAMRWTGNQGTDHIETGTATTGGKTGAELFRVPDDAPPDFVPEVRCESYRTPDQLAESHWLPWPESPDPSRDGSQPAEPSALMPDAFDCDVGEALDIDAEPDYQADYLHRWHTYDGCDVRLDYIMTRTGECVAGTDDLLIGWPLGESHAKPNDFRIFLRDPDGATDNRGAFDPAAMVPAEAQDSGLRWDGYALWMVAGHDESVWLRASDHAERWPLEVPMFGCL